MIEAIKANIENRIQKTIGAFQVELGKLRTGRAHPSLIESVRVTQYGSELLLNRLASISVVDAKTLLVTPWDKAASQAIIKAILSAELGLNPTVEGSAIRIPLPPLTVERRHILVKLIKKEAENARISVRNHRREANTQLKELLKKKRLNEDEEKRAQERVQKITDQSIGEIDKIAASKEKELLEV